jgi:hypothetical protein
MDGRMILKWIYREHDERLWNAFILASNTDQWRAAVNKVTKASVA